MRPRHAPVAVVAAVVLCLGAAGGCGSGEVKEAFYLTLQAARDGGAVSAGWVPPFLPPSTTSLHEVHDLGSGASLLFFTFSAGDLSGLVAPCQAVSESDVPPPPERLGRTAWWPRDLLIERRGGLRLFRCADPSGRSPAPSWLGVDVARGLGYHWRAGT